MSLGKVVENHNLQIASQVVHMVAAYFDLDVEVHLIVGKLEDSWAETICYCEGFGEIEFDKEFIRNASRDEVITVTAHEMVHIKQYECDGLMLSEKAAYFKGKKWRGEYWFSPWEVEARGHEQAFLHFFDQLQENFS